MIIALIVISDLYLKMFNSSVLSFHLTILVYFALYSWLYTLSLRRIFILFTSQGWIIWWFGEIASFISLTDKEITFSLSPVSKKQTALILLHRKRNLIEYSRVNLLWESFIRKSGYLEERSRIVKWTGPKARWKNYLVVILTPVTQQVIPSLAFWCPSFWSREAFAASLLRKLRSRQKILGVICYNVSGRISP